MTTLPHVELRTSRIGFGVSRLHHARSSRQRQAVLDAAFDAGIRHFDTAPAYGHGLCERELGYFLRRHRRDCTVATKYGIPPAAWIDRLAHLSSGLTRPAIAALSVARRAGLSSAPRPPLTAAALERSVHASLRRLGVDRIDVHLLHEPTVSRCHDINALIEKYHRLAEQGLVGAFGFAGSYAACRELYEEVGNDQLVLQTAEKEWQPDLVPDITYGVMSTGAQSFGSTAQIDGNEALRRIERALARRPRGVVLVSTTRTERLQQIAGVASSSGAGT